MSVKLENVSFYYPGSAPVLKGISMTAENGQITAIVGDNAVGKTTLAKLICGLLQPVSGEVRLYGKASLVMQNPENQLFSETVLKDVMFGPENLKLENPRELAAKALLQVGLDPTLWDKDPFKLSGGQQKRCAIAGVIAMNRLNIVFDESIAGLDSKGRAMYFDILQQEKKKGHAVITITHNIHEIALADKVIKLNPMP